MGISPESQKVIISPIEHDNQTNTLLLSPWKLDEYLEKPHLHDS